MRERIALSNPTQTAVKGLRDAAKISLYRSAMRRDIFEIYFRRICNLTLSSDWRFEPGRGDWRNRADSARARRVYRGRPGRIAVARRAARPRHVPASVAPA